MSFIINFLLLLFFISLRLLLRIFILGTFWLFLILVTIYKLGLFFHFFIYFEKAQSRLRCLISWVVSFDEVSLLKTLTLLYHCFWFFSYIVSEYPCIHVDPCHLPKFAVTTSITYFERAFFKLYELISNTNLSSELGSYTHSLTLLIISSNLF